MTGSPALRCFAAFIKSLAAAPLGFAIWQPIRRRQAGQPGAAYAVVVTDKVSKRDTKPAMGRRKIRPVAGRLSAMARALAA